MDVGQRVTPIRLIAGHLNELASFLETLDNSIEVGSREGSESQPQFSVWCTVPEGTEGKKMPLETITELAEGIFIVDLCHELCIINNCWP